MSDYPTRFGVSPLYGNPEVTLPMPAGQGMPVALWEETEVSLSWNAVAGTWSGPVVVPDAAGAGLNYWQGGSYQMLWSTPIFDLRPDLRSGQGGVKNGVPIWRSDAKLYIQITDLITGSSSNVTGMRLVARDMANTTFAVITSRPEVAPMNSIYFVSSNIDVCTQLVQPAGQPPSIVIVASPPGTSAGGGGNTPVRYWRFVLVFEARSTGEVNDDVFTPTAPARLKLQASVY